MNSPWAPVRTDPDDYIRVPPAPFVVSIDSPDGQYIAGQQTWHGVFELLKPYAPLRGWRVEVRPLGEDVGRPDGPGDNVPADVVGVHISYVPNRQEIAFHAGRPE